MSNQLRPYPVQSENIDLDHHNKIQPWLKEYDAQLLHRLGQ